MADLSTTNLEMEIHELSDVLSRAKWDDGVSESYHRFIEEERRCLSNLNWHTNVANKADNHVRSVDVEKLASNYSECLSKFIRLQRGG